VMLLPLMEARSGFGYISLGLFLRVRFHVCTVEATSDTKSLSEKSHCDWHANRTLNRLCKQPLIKSIHGFP
jgi:hypothetical protein